MCGTQGPAHGACRTQISALKISDIGAGTEFPYQCIPHHHMFVFLLRLQVQMLKKRRLMVSVILQRGSAVHYSGSKAWIHCWILNISQSVFRSIPVSADV